MSTEDSKDPVEVTDTGEFVITKADPKEDKTGQPDEEEKDETSEENKTAKPDENIEETDDQQKKDPAEEDNKQELTEPEIICIDKFVYMMPTDQPEQADTKQPEQSEQNTEKPRKRLPHAVKILIAVFIGVASLACVYIVFCFSGIKSEIYQSTVINGVDITGMTKEEAADAVQAKFEDEYSDSAYTVTVKGESYSIPVFPLLSIDVSESIDEAYSLCHGEWYTRGFEYLQNQYTPSKTVEITIQPDVQNTDEIKSAVDDIADAFASSVVDSSWNYDGNLVTVTIGTHGESIDANKVYNEIITGLAKQEYTGTVEATIIEAEPAQVNTKEIVDAVYVAPVDAKYELQDGQVIVTPSTPGEQISEEEIATAISTAQEGSVLTFEKTSIEPGIKEDTLQAELFRDVIASYDVVDGGSPSQKTNQGLACSAVNGAIVMPGEVFSFIGLVGDTTADKGYVPDYAYSNGHLVTEYGGGICRVASTLYAAILNSNLEIEMRYPHSSPVHYLPLGMDATVSYPAPDLQFRNNQGHPVKVNMWLDGGFVHAEIIGTVSEEDPIVEVHLNPVSDMIVETWRVYYDRASGALLENEYISTSVYNELIYDYDEED